MLKRILLAAAVTASLSLTAHAADKMVFTAWGGTTQEAQKKAFADTFTAKTGVEVLQDGPTDYGKLKAMVESGNVAWDVVDVEMDFAIAAAKQGLLEPIDFAVVDKSKIDPRFAADHFVGSFYYSFVIGYNKDVLKETPQNWADLFDMAKFPGKRTFYKWSAPGALEIALLADGVPADKLYPLDLDRAFKKLDTIKKDVVWWESGAQGPQLLADGQVVFATSWNGRFYNAIKTDKKPFKIIWDRQAPDWDWWAIPKGTPKLDGAYRFITFASDPQRMADQTKWISYGPANKDSAPLIDPAILPDLPSAPDNLKTVFYPDPQFWGDKGDELRERFNAWLAQ
jgi:putative spermidine/putrescine transport system substrate-binding protein